MDIITGYFAAPVRGKGGDDVDPQTKLENVELGIAIGQSIAEAFPCLDLYIPHEHEDMIDSLCRNGVSSKQILDACCDILGTKQLLIVYTGNGVSSGMETEIKFAWETDMSIIQFDSWGDHARERIARAMMEVKDNGKYC